MKKKLSIGILTYNKCINFGCVLQAYAMKKIFGKYGKVLLINYFTDYHYYGYSLDPSFLFKKNHINSKLKFFIHLFKKIFKIRNIIYKQKEFNFFIKNYLDLDTKTRLRNEEDLQKLKKLDFYVFGSDQIWNKIDQSIDLNYFGNFTKSKNKIFFSASMKNADEIFFKNKYIKKLLNQSLYLSVRETYIKNIINKTLNIKAETTLDPTLLLSQKHWSNLSNKSKIKIKKKYILKYDLYKDTHLHNTAKLISEKMDKKMIELTGYPNFNLLNFNLIQKAGPFDFIYLIKNSSFVITSSYHGVIFSIIFKKQFYVICKKENAYRILDFLRKIQLENRIIENEDQINFKTIINYNSVYQILFKKIKKSELFVQNIFKKS